MESSGHLYTGRASLRWQPDSGSSTATQGKKKKKQAFYESVSSFLRIPAPIVAPGFVCPDRSRNDSDGPGGCPVSSYFAILASTQKALSGEQEAEAQQERSVCQVIQRNGQLVILATMGVILL